MIQVNRIYLIFNRLVTKKFLVDTSVTIYNVQLGCAMSAALAVLSNISCLSDFTLPIRHVTLILHSEMVLCKLSNCT